ncbi:MAG: hypothetical protein Q8N48_14155 [Thiobacillus sp.]|nr:hypothetical protein [Thiobacillus sp.]MDP2979957.1 hypothetical protein [Thiobacillus sp.]
MAKTKKSTHQPSLPFPSAAGSLHQDGNWLWIPVVDQQKTLAQALNDAVASAKNKRTETATLRKSAWAAFESTLFTASEETSA